LPSLPSVAHPLLSFAQLFPVLFLLSRPSLPSHFRLDVVWLLPFFSQEQPSSAPLSDAPPLRVLSYAVRISSPAHLQFAFFPPPFVLPRASLPRLSLFAAGVAFHEPAKTFLLESAWLPLPVFSSLLLPFSCSRVLVVPSPSSLQLFFPHSFCQPQLFSFSSPPPGQP